MLSSNKYSYICAMKNLFYIIGLLICTMLFAPEEGGQFVCDNISYTTDSSMMEEMNTSNDTQRNFEELSNELKSCNCLTPRRVSQTNCNNFDLRSWKIVEKALQDMCLRNTNQLHLISQHTSASLGINLSTLIFRMGEHVFSLRKLII